MPVVGDMSILAIDDNEYTIKDATAREQLQTLETNIGDINQYAFSYEQATETLKNNNFKGRWIKCQM